MTWLLEKIRKKSTEDKCELENSENRYIKSEIIRLGEMLSKQEEKFNMADDDDIIDALVHERISLEARYKYLLTLAKEKKVSISYIDRLS